MNKLVLLIGIAFFAGCGSDSSTTNVADGATASEVEQYRAMVEESEKAAAEAAAAQADYKAGPEG
ncbi:hypothetical protein [Neorhodopirellula pilleata]|uniref:Uncharacterized protein n=1 Tax=Neorhodopirellula pilleata TaxID=2714738 RepID=A0A5C5ZCX3_9BACT|nr:hypothetical protein [Neorhodopirellula pilleata]TWT85184.1 hypothetical protein Pla100_62860 [Neorhodopirellula pilleata]